MSEAPTLHLMLPADLSTVLTFFEIHCVPECCGLDAYDFDEVYASHAIAAKGTALVHHAMIAVQGIISQIRVSPVDGNVECMGINVLWSRSEALQFFEMLEQQILSGLQIGPVSPNDPHPRNDPNQRFLR